MNSRSEEKSGTLSFRSSAASSVCVFVSVCECLFVSASVALPLPSPRFSPHVFIFSFSPIGVPPTNILSPLPWAPFFSATQPTIFEDAKKKRKGGGKAMVLRDLLILAVQLGLDHVVHQLFGHGERRFLQALRAMQIGEKRAPFHWRSLHVASARVPSTSCFERIRVTDLIVSHEPGASFPMMRVFGDTTPPQRVCDLFK